MLRALKQSTATTLLLGPFVDETDGQTAETALTISQADVLLWKQGGTTLAQKNESTSCTHRSNGLYTCPVDTTDTNTLGILTVSVDEGGALPIRQDYTVVPANIWDSLVGGTDAVDVSVIQWLGTAAATPTVAGVPEVDVTHWNGTAVATPDTAGYPKTTVKSGTGTGEISLTSGVASVNATQINSVAAAAARLALSAGQIIPFTVDTTGFAGSSTTFQTNLTEATADHYKDRLVLWTTGALAGQQALVTVYALSGGLGRFTVSTMTETPANGDTGVLV
jgi:hypothetical protein